MRWSSRETTLRVKGGRLLDYSKDPNRKLCRLHLAMMDRMGARVEQR